MKNRVVIEIKAAEGGDDAKLLQAVCEYFEAKAKRAGRHGSKTR